MITIYLATNTKNGKRYVGQTSRGIKRRAQEHKTGCRKSETILTKAIIKYGYDNFEWKELSFCETADEADHIEEVMIRCLQTHYSTGRGYNRAIGGKVRRGWKHSEQTRQKFMGRKSWNTGLKGVNKPWNKGKKGWNVYDETRRAELRAQVSEQMQGNRNASGNTNNRKAVRCIDNGMVFQSLYHASEWVRGKFERSEISAVCNGRKKSAYGHRWEFVCQ